MWNVQLRPTTSMIIQEDVGQLGVEPPFQTLESPPMGFPASPTSPSTAGTLSPALQSIEKSRDTTKVLSGGNRNSTAVQGLDSLLERLGQCTSFECLKTVQLELVGRTRFNVPHFFLIGWQKCATSSIYNHLRRHPEFLPAPTKVGL